VAASADDARRRTPFQMLIMMFAGWVNEHQRTVIAYLLEENRALREFHVQQRPTKAAGGEGQGTGPASAS
jgi:hypothetical protein